MAGFAAVPYFDDGEEDLPKSHEATELNTDLLEVREANDRLMEVLREKGREIDKHVKDKEQLLQQQKKNEKELQQLRAANELLQNQLGREVTGDGTDLGALSTEQDSDISSLLPKQVEQQGSSDDQGSVDEISITKVPVEESEQKQDEIENNLTTKYFELKQSLEQNKQVYEYVQQLCCLPAMQKIYIGLIPHNEQDQLTQYLKQKYPDERIEVVIQTVNDTDWLSIPRISEFLGPGAALIKDENLNIYTHYNKHRSKVHSVHDSLQVEDLAWGSLGCFVKQRLPNKRPVIHGLTAQHVISKPSEALHSGEDRHVISLFKHTSTICTLQEMGGTYVQTEAEDIVHMCSNNMIGTCGNIMVNDRNVIIDAVLFRLNDSVLNLHGEFLLKDEEKMKPVNFNEFEELYTKSSVYVKKVGATTGVKKGVILTMNHEHELPDNENIKGEGTFVVTSVDIYGQPHEHGEFARKGDSGSLVLLDNGEAEKKIIGIVHNTKKQIKRGKMIFRNVTICVRMDYCEKMLLDNLEPESQLDYYFNFLKPHLHLERSETIPKHLNLQNSVIVYDRC